MQQLRTLHAKPPYDPAKDFVAVSGLYATPLVLVANKDSGIDSIAALKAAAQKEPGKLMHGSATGSSQHLAAELLRFRAGIDITHVAYKGSGPAMIDLLSGQIPLMVDGLSSAMPHISADKVIAVAVTTPERVPSLPEVPTVAEQGVRDKLAARGTIPAPSSPKETADFVRGDTEKWAEVAKAANIKLD